MNMKKNMMKAILALTAMIAAFAFTSCSKDNDDKTNERSEASVQPILYIAEDMVKYFDITYDIDGQKVSITKDNTTAKQVKVTVLNKELVYNFLVYTGQVKKVTSFPTTFTCTATATVKDGIKLQEQEKSDVSLIQDFNLGDTSIGGGLNAKLLGSYHGGVDWATVYQKGQLDTFLSKYAKSTYTVQLNSASNVTANPVE